MFISRIAFVALSAVFTFVQAIPSPVGKDALVARDTSADVTSILNDLKSKTDSILPQIGWFLYIPLSFAFHADHYLIRLPRRWRNRL